MNKPLMFVVVGLISACSPETVQETLPASVAPLPTYEAATIYNSTSVFQADDYGWSSDDKTLLVGSNESGIYNVYRVDVETGVFTAMTHSTDDAIFVVSGFPNDDRVIYHADKGGDELDHIFVLEATGEVIDVTPGEGLKANFEGWGKSRKHFFITSNQRDPLAFDLFRVSIDDYSLEMIFENNNGWTFAGTSSNGQYLALIKQQSNTDNDIYLVDTLGDAKPKLISPNEHDIDYVVYAFTKDDLQLVFGTNEHGEFRQAWTYELQTGEILPLVQANWDVSFVSYSESGRYRVSGVNNDATMQVSIMARESGDELKLPELNGNPGQIRFSRNEKKLSLVLNSDTSPSDLYIVDLATGNSQRLTNSLNPEIDESVLVNGEVIRYPSFDELQIPGILYRPNNANAGNKVPALVWVHGGPGGQSRTGYRPMIQLLVNHGYAVLAANNRGSSGYGKTFFHMDDRKHGEVDLDDIVFAKNYLSTLDWVDANRVGIIGGSYGGYMVGAALAFRPDEFEVGVNIFGVMNWVRTLESIPPWWDARRKSLHDELGNPETDKDRLTRISPLFHAENIRVPLLVVQGANDPRVLKIESDEIVKAVRENGVPVDYIVFDDEGHGFSKRVNEIATGHAIISFLDRELKGKSIDQKATGLKVGH